MKPLRNDEVEDMKNAWDRQKENSIESSAYHQSYCEGCGNIECTCLYKARKKAIENGGGTASGFLSFIAFVLFALFAAIVAKAIGII